MYIDRRRRCICEHLLYIFVLCSFYCIFKNCLSVALHCIFLAFRLQLLNKRELSWVDELPQQSLKDVFRATVESKIQYAAPAWSGLCTAGDRVQLNAFLRRCMKLGYRERDAPSIEEIFAMSDDQLFSKINSNSLHILQQFMSDRPILNYSLRARPHNKTLIAKTTQLND